MRKTKARSAFILLCTLLYSGINAQLYDPFPLPDSIPDNYKINTYQKISSIVNTTPAGVSSEQWTAFANWNAYCQRDDISEGYIYLNWPELESYLNRVLQRIMPESLKTDTNIRVLVTRGTATNAGAFFDGTIYFNIGMFVMLEDEAALAEILAHELSHYIYKDGRDNFVNRIIMYNSLEKAKRSEWLKIQLAHFSKPQGAELRADTNGYRLLANAGYSLHSAVNNHRRFQSQEEWSINQYGHKSNKHFIYINKDDERYKNVNIDSLDYALSTHPDNKKREVYLHQFIETEEKTKHGKTSLVSASEFMKFKKMAIMEVMHIRFSNGNYKVCAAVAFSEYLNNDKSEAVMYFLTESLRRYIYIYPNLRNKGIFTEDSKSKVFKDGKLGILHGLDHLISLPDSQKSSLINKFSKNGNFVFETYAEAFEYFVKESVAMQHVEANLSLALYHEWICNKEEQQNWLLKYLSFPGAKFKNYANNLFKDVARNDTINKTKHIYVLNKIVVTNKKNRYWHYDYIHTGDKNNAVENGVKSVLQSHKPFEFVGISDLSKEGGLSLNCKWNELYNLLSLFKPEKEILNEMLPVPNLKRYWESRVLSEPMDKDVMRYRKKFFILSPEWYVWLADKGIGAVTFLDYRFNSRSLTDQEIYLYLDISEYDFNNSRYFMDSAPKEDALIYGTETTKRLLRDCLAARKDFYDRWTK